ncbi:DEAD/DEAH box helicase [Candidatus Woesearchaeota archaeon]|nr:MAG: DEAD/DEAH box helicase [Candidatus Woesearchaeota archaeon]
MTFEELNLHPDILKAVKRAGFIEPTTIQKRCIPEIKAGKDVVAQSLTGSGKTAAFGLPLLEKISAGKGLQALILTPTRELAVQVKETLSQYAMFLKLNITAVYGGVGLQPQIDALKTADIVVATPGRMTDHMQRKTIDMHDVHFLVIDEMDKMFEMGFIEDVQKIIQAIPKQRQTLLFSATISEEIHQIIRKYLKSPVNIKEQIHVHKSFLKQVYYDVHKEEKFSLLVHLLKHKTPGLAIVFCGTRMAVDSVARNLKMQKIKAMAVHGGLSQNKRTFAVNSIKQEDIQVLVATDVAARGLDLQNISHVYNYDSPKTSSEYIHRIGRTARAGKSGEAVTLLVDRDHDNFRNVMSDRSLQIVKEQVPKFERIPFIRDRGSFGRGPGRQQGYRQGSFQGRGRSEERGHSQARQGSSRGPSRRFDDRDSGNRSQGSFRKSKFTRNQYNI